MIDPKKLSAAIRAIQDIIIQARLMAYQQESFEKLAVLLDHAEYLPGLMLEEDDRTQNFADYLAQIGRQFPKCQYAVERFHE